MPGPLSAPNGNDMLCHRRPEDHKRIDTGKTALKHGKIEHARKISGERRVRKAMAQWRRENENDES